MYVPVTRDTRNTELRFLRRSGLPPDPVRSEASGPCWVLAHVPIYVRTTGIASRAAGRRLERRLVGGPRFPLGRAVQGATLFGTMTDLDSSKIKMLVFLEK